MKIHKPVRVPITPFPDEPYALSSEDLRAYLTHAGTLLYGPTSWQTPLAHALNLTPRMMRYYTSGERTPPLKLLYTLSRLLSQHSQACLDASRELAECWDRITSLPVSAGPSKVLVPKPPRHPGDYSPLTLRRKRRAGKA